MIDVASHRTRRCTCSSVWSEAAASVAGGAISVTWSPYTAADGRLIRLVCSYQLLQASPMEGDMLVRDAMNPVTVTIGPSHTMRDAARRMMAGGTGAAIVFDPEMPGPGIVTERDVLAVAGNDQDLDHELVRDHLPSELVYAEPDWPLHRAAEAMTAGRFRHI